ncbi:ThuA domain-containing protein [Nocardioides sp. zg-1228]|uniref:ThuA domain-containing protein n=1 Tax=Nocardioides sp. zg-1228 TaxID=2763008 RepID=UPI001980D0C5|nr:ThuA domain-containing protein [Nocardioides sp. zg-1228]QSF56523.1 ThuA domain-containing protein [Nocardioides sp. zg-1228]
MNRLITRLQKHSRAAVGSTMALIVSLPLGATIGLASTASAAVPDAAPDRASAPAEKANKATKKATKKADLTPAQESTLGEAVPWTADADASAAAAADESFDALLFSRTAAFRHDNIGAATTAIQALAASNNFTVTATEDASAFNDANLANYEVVIFLSTTGDVLNPAEQAAFERYIQAGGGYAGIHAASDTEYDWPWYGQLVGAYFNNHPPGTPQATVKVEDPAHPSTRTLERRWTRNDEWYNFRTNPAANPRTKLHVLASVDETTYTPGNGSMGAEHPIAWCQDYDGGRSWYTGMGHTAAAFTDAKFLEHVLGGIQTAAGALDADCKATLAPSFEKVALDENTSNPMELAIADDGRVFYIDRNGAVRIIKEDGSVVTAGTVPVYTGQEFGLLGIALDPDFATNNWVYLYYSPNGSESIDRISRFTMAGDTLQLGTATTILDVPTQRNECCHAGGSMEFDNDGNLYLATGDNTNPFDSGGYTPIDERPNRAAWDAQRTSGNTNSLNGKVLRIRPKADGGYTVPAGNLFDEAADTQQKTRPEIYAMGFRNPFRIGLDEQNNNILVADYGPDAGSTSATRGPNGRVEWNILDEPGNYGWPYCVGNNTPYNDYNFANSTAGATFDCAAPVNDSPNNTGLTNLPPAKPAVIWQSNNGTITGTPEIGASGAPMTSGTYDYDPDLVSDRKWPEYFDSKAIWADWNNNRLFTVQMNQAGTNYTDINRFLSNLPMQRPHALQFGPDGALYMIEWGSGFNGNNTDSGVYRIDYVEGNRAPVARATTDRTSGPAPLTVEFDGTGSFDPDTGDDTGLTYAWDFTGDGSTDATTPTASFTYSTAGNYTARLTVTDVDGRSGTTNIDITAGNTAPTVELVLPKDGGFFEFGDYVAYEVVVTDPEDGTIDCDDVVVQPGLGHDQHSHDYEQYRGCSGTLALPGDAGHTGANIFGTIKATYTDKGSGAAGALTSVDGIVLHTKKKEAEFYDFTGRTGDNTAGSPGVTTQATTDSGGGQNVTGVETGDWFRWDVMNLTGITGVSMRAASTTAGATFEVRQGSATGTAIGTLTVPNTGGAQTYQTVTTTFTNATTTSQPLYFVATTGGANVNWLQFNGRGITDNQPPTVAFTASTTSGEAPLPVSFDSTVIDPDGNTPVTYAWDFGDGATSTQADPSHTYTTPGRYVVSLTATDARGAEATSTTEITVRRPSDTCFSGRSDDFLGNELDTDRWNRSVRVDQSLTVADGTLNIPLTNSDLYQTTNTTPNIVLQDLPGGAFEATTQVTLNATKGYQQAGLIVYGNDDNYLKLVYSGRSTAAAGSKAANVIQFAKEANGTATESNSANLGADFPDTVWLRMSSTDGSSVTASYSSDGDTWVPLATGNGNPAPARDLSGITAPKVGLLALGATAAGAADNLVAKFDYFTLTPDDTAEPCNNGCFVEEFNGSTLTSDWSTVRPSGNLTVSGGALTIPMEATDLYQTTNTARDLVLTDLPDGPFVATTKVTAPINQAYQSAGLLIYGDDDNYIKHVFQGRSTNGANAAQNIVQTAKETDAAAVETNTPGLGADFPTTVWLRLTSTDGEEVLGSYSTDGETWTDMSGGYDLTGIDEPRIGLLSAANQTAGAGITATFDWFTLGEDATCEPGGEPPVDTTDPEVAATVLGSYAGELVDQASTGITGEATMVSAAEGNGYTTTIELSLEGLDPQEGYESHLHVGTTCGGFEGHYRDDPDGAGTPPNELWPTNPGWTAGSGDPRIKPAADGTSFATATVPWAPRIEGGILALHRDGAIIGCVDLELTGAGTVVLDATDDVEVTSFTYTVDGGAETDYEGPFEITEPGEHTVAYTATDAAGNETTGEFTVVVPEADPGPDPEPGPKPTVTLTTSPAAANGRSNWFTSPVTVTLAGAGGEGKLSVEYRIGNGPWTAYTAPITVSDDGVTLVQARATDAAGKTSAVETTTIKKDGTAPTLAVAGIADGAKLDVSAVRTARITVTDATSGAAEQVVRLDGRAVTGPARIDAMSLRPGKHRLKVTAYDAAGNRTVQTITFKVVVSFKAGKKLVERLAEEGVVGPKLAVRLKQELKAAERADKRNQVGKALKSLKRFERLASRVKDKEVRLALKRLSRTLKSQL